MSDNILFLRWDRPVAGREHFAVELFSMVSSYLSKQQKSGVISSFEPVLLTVHSGDLNGFIIVRGEQAQLEALRRSDEFMALVMKSAVGLHGFGVIEGWTGEKLQTRLQEFGKAVAAI